MAGKLLDQLKVQIRVVRALAVREFQTQQSNLEYGYGWVIFDMILGMAGLLILRLAIKGFNRPGLPPMTFIISGIVPWSMFGQMYGVPISAVQRNQRLLSLPGVTPLDLVIASSLRILGTFALLYVVLMSASCLYEGVPPPRFTFGIVLLFLSFWIFGLSLGFMLMALQKLYTPASKFTSFFLRFSTFFSGVIFIVTLFPGYIWPYLTWNPMLHVEELLHTYWFRAYTTPIGKPSYVIECMVIMAFFGLLLERYCRKRFR
ncbi:MAG TPA: ABC transporter permease [Rhizomicrobium sp.]